MNKRTIGILTGGGDCPGLNAVIRGVTKTADKFGISVLGFHDGFLGMIEKRFDMLSFERVSGILTQGGTILGSSNTASPFEHVIAEGGQTRKIDVSQQCMELYRDLGLDALICVGGDGTLTIGGRFAEMGANIVGVPKTIDKDLMETDTTFGFDSAMVTATEAIDKLHTTAAAHHRVILVEVMGRNAGWLALESGIAGGGDVILIPEIPYDIELIAASIRRRSRFGRKFSIVVVSEGAMPIGGTQVVAKILADRPDPVRLGGISHVIADQLEKMTDLECRVTVLGHLQRGGTPSPIDRLLATRFGVKAVELVITRNFNQMVALHGIEMQSVPIQNVMGKQKKVPLDSPLIQVALSVGTTFGAPLDMSLRG
ncbi:MAG: ATP-dependent 6-phosphofructokinase [Deltaproteobacteria bacterium]|nr:ATP-dependent 6-phosphofructokinase [Deltaproteobacteria bacterium]